MAEHYCTLADVNALVPQQPFTASSIPNESQVAQFIEDCAQELDAVLNGLGYVVPVVTGEVSLNLLKRACAWGALGIAQDARTTAVYRDDSGGGQKSVWTQRFEAFKSDLQNPNKPFSLYDATKTSLEVVKPVGKIQSSIVNQPDASTYLEKPPFSIGMKF